jgi:hypothetical protein
MVNTVTYSDSLYLGILYLYIHPSRAGNNILKSLKPEYAIIKTNARRKTYSPIFSVQGLQGSNIDMIRSQIIAVETTMHNRYAIASENRKG